MQQSVQRLHRSHKCSSHVSLVQSTQISVEVSLQM